MSYSSSTLFSASRSTSPSTERAHASEPLSSTAAERARHTVDVHHLFDSEELSDVTLRLQCSNGACELHAHRLVLVVSSSYFASALSTLWQPTTSASSLTPADLLLSSDERLENMRTLIAFAYGCEVELTLLNAHPLLRLADFYGMPKLGELCLDYLERVLHPEPARCFALFDDEQLAVRDSGERSASAVDADVDADADRGDDDTYVGADVGRSHPLRPPAQPKLLALCAEVLARSFSDGSSHELFVSSCPVELVHAVLARDDLSIDREVEVLSTLLRWASAAPGRGQRKGKRASAGV